LRIISTLVFLKNNTIKLSISLATLRSIMQNATQKVHCITNLCPNSVNNTHHTKTSFTFHLNMFHVNASKRAASKKISCSAHPIVAQQ
jgi:hypothetical protein